MLSTLVVTTTSDTGPGSLRQAILDANAGPGGDTITFAIGGGGAQTIRPASALPAITRPVTIDGTTQPGFAGSPLIELNGSLVPGNGVVGLRLAAGSSAVKGLVINGFSGTASYGIELDNGGNLVAGDYVGSDITGKSAVPNRYGVVIVTGSRNNTIGGTTPEARNLISGNSFGVYVEDSGNLVQGNYIGTDITGKSAVPNFDGVDVISGAQSNTIGGTTAEARNLISGNAGTGLFLGGAGNLVQGNFIGTDGSGTAPLGNAVYGVTVAGDSNTIGGSATGAGNVISGNSSDSLDVTGRTNRVQGNAIGTDVSGTVVLGNGRGMYISGRLNTIGGAAAGEGNVISGNSGDGILLSGTLATGNQILGNFIGTNAAGGSLGNSRHGVFVAVGASGNSIGGVDGGGNTIGFNGQDGIRIDPGANTFTILGANVLLNQPTTIVTGVLRLGSAGSMGGAITLFTGATLDLKLNGTTPGSGYDQLNVSGAIDLSAGPTLHLSVGFASAIGDTFTLLTGGGGIRGTFSGLPDNATLLIDGKTFRINYTATTVLLTQVGSLTATTLTTQL